MTPYTLARTLGAAASLVARASAWAAVGSVGEVVALLDRAETLIARARLAMDASDPAQVPLPLALPPAPLPVPDPWTPPRIKAPRARKTMEVG